MPLTRKHEVNVGVKPSFRQVSLGTPPRRQGRSEHLLIAQQSDYSSEQDFHVQSAKDLPDMLSVGLAPPVDSRISSYIYLTTM